ncbi:MAG: metallophosphoesterase, partial [Dehalococcoidales bacterium]|nr:metallophosphoesterase [Dehalococcoidales bacterium]
LSGLEPDTIYHYRLVYGDTATEEYHFRTFPLSGPFTFVVYGDTQDQLPTFSQYERYKLVADAVAAEPDVAFVLSLGDQVNNGSDLTNWDRYFDVGRELMANTTVYPLLGNHENNSPLYYENFGLPEYYSFDCSDAHFTVLDTNSIADTSAETIWLDNDLNSDKAWKFVAFHHPMYTSDASHFGGWLNLQSLWEDILIEHGVDAVWNGHIHAYEHYLESGIHYLVMGTGGGPPGVLSETKYTGYQNSLEHSLAYAKVTIDPEAGTASVQIMRVADVSTDGTQVVTVYPPGTVYDSFTLTHTVITQPDWDLNGDKVCDIGDVVVLGLRWGETGTQGWIPQDLNSDGIIDIGDVVVLGLHWGQTW